MKASKKRSLKAIDQAIEIARAVAAERKRCESISLEDRIREIVRDELARHDGGEDWI